MHFFLTVLEARELKTKVTTDWMSGEGLLSRELSFCCHFTGQEDKGAPWSLFHKVSQNS